MITNSTCYLCVNTTLKVKTYLDKTRQLSKSLPTVPGPDWVSGLFSWKEMRFILPIKIPVVTPPTTSNWVCYTKMADQGTEILIIQDSDPELGTQKYFWFSVYFPNWGRTMPHFSRKWPEPSSSSSLNWNWAGLCGALEYKSFLCPLFLVCRI